MRFLQVLGFWVSCSFGAEARIGLTVQAFQVAGNPANNVKLSWLSTFNSSSFNIKRKVENSPYTVIGHAATGSYDDYGPPSGLLTYQITTDHDLSNEASTPSSVPASPGFLTFDNTKPSTLRLRSKIKLRNQYFAYEVQNVKGRKQIVEKTSPNGFVFSQGRVVLTSFQICAGSLSGTCKLESIIFLQHPNTSEVVMWAHWENGQSYHLGRLAVAFGQPGGKWTFGGSFRPLGHDSRDMSVFVDDDGAGYLISATRTNADLNIYALTRDWHNVSSLVTTVLQGQRREAPAMLRYKNFYYLFTSRASGWYPSAGQYISAPNVKGPWSPSRPIGNIAGFGAQSGQVTKLGSMWVMGANRWSGRWKPSEPSRQILLPISFSYGYASYHFYSSVRYSDDGNHGGVFGIQSGQIVSVGKKSIADKSSITAGRSNPINDGIQYETQNLCDIDKVPFTYEIDLGAAYRLSQVDLSTKLGTGCETAYQFTIEARPIPQAPYEIVVDQRRNGFPGFVTSSISSTQVYRYVKLNVLRVVNVHTQREASGEKGIAEWTVYATAFKR
ncbi:hypothetical protein O181_030840 [Austropuccinia psidii MF-1]|uniref:Uncharacterized protein n=1 Tax=Austropuccinia psidii MF-1 TaxID=1389203 RepID=A0A9Q3H6L8_9BASI|nr:hypothetical protein [Austropuccinia psidii MF-1]